MAVPKINHCIQSWFCGKKRRGKLGFRLSDRTEPARWKER